MSKQQLKLPASTTPEKAFPDKLFVQIKGELELTQAQWRCSITSGLSRDRDSFKS